jgi:hypothetical protein
VALQAVTTLRLARRRLVAAALVVALAGARVLRAQHAVDEYRLKAAVLYNLTKFVDWPADAFVNPSAPLVFCVLGVDPFGSALDEALRGRLVGRRMPAIRRVVDVDPACRVLFVANSEIRRLPAIVDRLGTSSVLTVGETADFVEQGGMIGLLTDADRIRFTINPSAAERGRLKISARVLALASSVVPAREGAR